jgi:hypothetical protein
MSPTPPLTALRDALREPTLHFAVLAAVLFALDAAFGSAREVEIDRGLLHLRVQIEQANVGRPLTPDEQRRVEERFVADRVLVAEARAMGLDEDERVYEILAQKMRHVLSAGVLQPTERELRDFYDVNRERYTRPAAVTVEELVISATSKGRETEARLRETGSVDAIDRTAVVAQTELRDVTADDLIPLVGREFTARLLAAPPGEWIGPHETARGHHWMRVREHTGGRAAVFDDIREQVRADWVASVEESRIAARVDELRQEYRIVFTEGGE